MLIGTPNREREPALATTLTRAIPRGPACSPGSAGLARLPHHREAAKAAIAPSDYDEHVALMAMAMDVDAIGGAVRAAGCARARADPARVTHDSTRDHRLRPRLGRGHA